MWDRAHTTPGNYPLLYPSFTRLHICRPHSVLAATKKGRQEDGSGHVLYKQQSRMPGGTEGKLSQAECLDFSLKNTYLIKVKGIKSIMRWKATEGFGLSFNLLSSQQSNENTFERISTPAFQHLRSYFIQALHYIWYLRLCSDHYNQEHWRWW